METLEVTESGTWSDLSVVHQDLIADQLSPSGLANRYGAIPFAFPAAVELNELGAISDALVARRRHDNPTVVGEKMIILKDTTEQRQQYIASWRQDSHQCDMRSFRNGQGDRNTFVWREVPLFPQVVVLFLIE